LSYPRIHCKEAIGVIQIESIFIKGSIETICTRLLEFTIVKDRPEIMPNFINSEDISDDNEE